MFPYAIDVRSRRIDVEFEERGKSAPDDLERLNEEFQRRFQPYMKAMDGVVGITSGVAGNPYHMGPNHNRSMGVGDRNELVLKGSGYGSWRQSDSFDMSYAKIPILFRDGDIARRFPIVRNLSLGMNGAMWSHAYIGGLDETRAMMELENALAIIHSCDLAGVERPELYPLLVSRPLELPVEENGELKLLNRKEYCDQRFAGERKGRVLKAPEFDDLAVYAYVCPDAAFRVGYMKDLSGILQNDISLTDAEREKTVLDFAKRFGSIVAAVHLNGGRFSEGYVGRDGMYRAVSSLADSNVTISGTPLDFDTVSFGEQDRSLGDDWINAVNTLGVISTFYDDMRNPRPVRKVLEIEEYSISTKSVGEMNLFRKSLIAFMDVQREILKEQFVSPLKIIRKKKEE